MYRVLCQGSDTYPVRVQEDFVLRNERGIGICRVDARTAEQVGAEEKSLSGKCKVCKYEGLEICDDGALIFHHRTISR